MFQEWIRGDKRTPKIENVSFRFVGRSGDGAKKYHCANRITSRNGYGYSVPLRSTGALHIGIFWEDER